MSKKHGMDGKKPDVSVSSDKKEGNVVEAAFGVEGNKERTASGDRSLDPRVDCMGQFVVPMSHVYSNLDHMIDFFKDVVVVSADIRPSPQGNLILYTGVSQKYFHAVPDHSEVPMYSIARRADGVFVVQSVAPMPRTPGGGGSPIVHP